MSRIFNIKQLPTASYGITGSFTGSFIGDGSKLTDIPSPPQINFNSVTASVQDPNYTFLLSSASIELFKINSLGSTTIHSDASDIFLIKNFAGANVLTVSQSGIITVATSSNQLYDPAPNGGIYFTSSSFFIGLSD